MTIEKFKNHPAYLYALESVDDCNVPKYVQKQCNEFLEIINNHYKKDYKWIIDLKLVDKINKLLKLMYFSSGTRVGTPIVDGLGKFQWFFIINILCIKHRQDTEKRRYEKAVLLIGRKSGKSFLIGLIFKLLMLLEPRFSEFYSVAPDRQLSSIVKKECEQLIAVSPAMTSRFKPLRDRIECTLTDSKFIPLANSNHRMDGRKANVFVADEVGALPSRYPIDAMSSSQMGMKNRLGILISTAYETLINPMTEEVEYCEKVLDGVVEDETVFSLLYKPDDSKDWTSDKTLKQANPLAIEVVENYDYLVKQRQKAIDMPSTRPNFLTKHLNIFINNDSQDKYLDFELWKKCGVDNVDFKGKEVVVGIDASLTTDLTAISMMYKEDGKYYVKAIGILPSESLKTRNEKFDYKLSESKGECYINEGYIVDYNFLEQFIRDIPKRYNCTIKEVCYDSYNMTQTAQRLADTFDVVEIKQNFFNLSNPTKTFREQVYLGNIRYEKSSIFDWNISNCSTVKDKNENEMITKKNKNKMRIDLVASTIFAFKQAYSEEQIKKFNIDDIFII
ncbi:MAG: terminase TerL endonuclease subunit [Peptostreptococcaceae bacterium]